MIPVLTTREYLFPIQVTIGKVIFSQNSKGVLEMHGKQYHPTWSRLKANVDPGDDRLYLQDNVNWEPGQRVLITTTFYSDDWWDQNEVLEIKAVDRNLIQFRSPIKNHHYAGIEYQAEVGLLSRRILLQGDESSENEKYGGHVLIMGEGRISGVATYRMGQMNKLGR